MYTAVLHSPKYVKMANIPELRVGSGDYANSSVECQIRIKETMMDRGPFVVLTPKDN